MEIRNGSSEESYTNKVLYDESSYRYPAYVANAGFGHTYEYALADKGDNENTYIYLAYPNSDMKEYTEYLLIDRSIYDEDDKTGAFTIYNHSFDGGNSCDEFDD